MFSNVICIHLRRFKSVEDFQSLLDDNGLDTIDPESLHTIMLEGFTKIYLDVNTHKIVALTHIDNKKMIQISEDFIVYLRRMNSITKKSKRNNLSIDSILDKINLKGIESLTEKEKDFLKNNS
jgi:hypothetical protein